jgi:phosphoribosylamine--glycine ligase
MKVLVIGGGGREHALAWKFKQSQDVTEVCCAPGNGGTASFATNVPIAADDVSALLDYAKAKKIDLTFVGPEAPLTQGIVDVFKRNGLMIFGPTREAAELEASKAFTKEFCQRHKIPTARAGIFTNPAEALEYVSNQKAPLVVKADGLAAGKGVIICRTIEEAEAAVNNMFVDRSFGDAGDKVVVEECLTGEEASFLVFSDGNHVLPLASSQDHKRIGDDDTGPNTGGMGAYSPAPVVTSEVYERIMEKIILPTVRGMTTEGRAFTGVLYAGVMIRDGEPYLLEYNVRFGDPEAQPLLVRLKTDLADVAKACVKGQLNTVHLEWDPRPAVCVVMSAEGYPGDYEKGREISGLPLAEALPDVTVFHAGTKVENGKVLTNGGRVLGVTALGDDIPSAIANAYEAVGKINWDGCYYRKDIGKKALVRAHEKSK